MPEPDVLLNVVEYCSTIIVIQTRQSISGVRGLKYRNSNAIFLNKQNKKNHTEQQNQLTIILGASQQISGTYLDRA